MQYTYSIVNNTKNSRVTLKDLESEIISSSIDKTLETLKTEGDEIHTIFSDVLSVPEQSTLLAVLQAHEGIIPTESVIPSEVKVVEEVASAPFTSKTLASGQKLFKRIHGVQSTVSANSTQSIQFTVPYNQAKINGLEIIGASLGDTANFKVYDNAAGTVSTIPNYLLNQFGYNVCMSKDLHVEISAYDADVILGMVLELEFTNNTNNSALIGANFILHELV